MVGSHHGPHLKHWVVGSTVEKLVQGASCPVLVANPRPRKPAKLEPMIEPRCTDCTRTRGATGGLQWWCERHLQRADRGHAFSYQRELPFAPHNSEVIPSGIEF